jgi:hypothetical protein
MWEEKGRKGPIWGSRERVGRCYQWEEGGGGKRV